jgi:hypothetical protein
MNNKKMTGGGTGENTRGETEKITLLERGDLPGSAWVAVDHNLWKPETKTENLFQWKEQGIEQPLVASAILRSGDSRTAEQRIKRIEERKSENADITESDELDIADRGIGLKMTYGPVRSTEAYFRDGSDVGAIMIRDVPDAATDFPVEHTIPQLSELAESMY